MTRKLASTLLAAVPESDYETALKWFEKAEQVQPDFYIDNTFMIGKCYAKDCSLFESKLKLIRQRKKSFRNFSNYVPPGCAFSRLSSRGGQIAVWPRPKNLVWQKIRPIFFWSGIWSGGLAFGLAVWSNRNRTKSVLNGMFAFFLGGIPIFMIHNE